MDRFYEFHEDAAAAHPLRPPTFRWSLPAQTAQATSH
jgi:hypothetical protein